MMRGVLIWSGEADAAKVAGRMASFVEEMETACGECFAELLCVRAGDKNHADIKAQENPAYALTYALQACSGPECTVIPEFWEIPEELPVQLKCDTLLRYLEEAGTGVLAFYGNAPGRQLGTLVAARQKKACIVNTEHVGCLRNTAGGTFYAERKVCSGHLSCQVGFVPEESVIVLAPEGDVRQPAPDEKDAEKRRQMSNTLTAAVRTRGWKPCTEESAGAAVRTRGWKPCTEESAGAAVRTRGWKPCTEESAGAAVRILERIPKEAVADLESAQVVFVGGRGLRSAENFRRLIALAEKMGAAWGCTRPAAMAGWTDFSRVVGISGSSLHAKVCVTFGVSGSAAFLCGTEQVGHLVAVNSDKNAPIFLSADTGIQGDCMCIMEALEKGDEEGWRI